MTNCFHSGSGTAGQSLKITLAEKTTVDKITIVGRTHQTNQGDNLQVLVDDQPCGGASKRWHTASERVKRAPTPTRKGHIKEGAGGFLVALAPPRALL